MGRRALVLLVALLLAGVAAFAVFQFLNGIRNDVEANREKTPVFRATQFIPEGSDGSLAYQSAWFAAGARGPDVDAAVAAWREQAQDDFEVMWRSLPAAVRAGPRPRRVEALRERAGVPEDAPDDGEGAAVRATEPEAEGFDVHWLAAWVLAIAFVVFAVIGFVTVLAWVVPG